MHRAMRGVDYCFHAAALKQVPSCEFHPMEAVRTNILGTDNVLEAAVAARIKKVVCLITDKAVYPINAMGISKAMMEKVMVAESRNLASAAVRDLRHPLRQRDGVARVSDSAFHQQILAGMPITITDPAMTRFMMTLDKAVELVLYAFEHGSNGDIFVQKAPAATVAIIAEGAEQLFGKRQTTRCTRSALGMARNYTRRCSAGRRSSPRTISADYYRVPPDAARPELREVRRGRGKSGSIGARTTIRTTPRRLDRRLSIKAFRELKMWPGLQQAALRPEEG